MGRVGVLDLFWFWVAFRIWSYVWCLNCLLSKRNNHFALCQCDVAKFISGSCEWCAALRFIGCNLRYISVCLLSGFVSQLIEVKQRRFDLHLHKMESSRSLIVYALGVGTFFGPPRQPIAKCQTVKLLVAKSETFFPCVQCGKQSSSKFMWFGFYHHQGWTLGGLSGVPDGNLTNAMICCSKQV